MKTERIFLDGEEIFENKVVSRGTKVEIVQNNDLSNDGIVPINQPTELGESLKHLNDDTLDSETRMSGIDLRANLHLSEMSSVLAVDWCVAVGVIPSKCLMLTRQKKRLSRSIQGFGSNQIVDLVSGKQNQDAQKGGGSLADRIGSWFSPNKEGTK